MSFPVAAVTASRRILLAGVLLLAVVPACSPRAVRVAEPAPPAAAPPAASESIAMEERWGVQIIGMRMSGGGHMLDFRYRVIDPEKARPLFKRQTKPQLIDQASGRSLSVPNMPKIGPLRNSDIPRAGTNYWMFFGNTGNLVKAGSRVTVVIGEFRVQDLVVE